MQREGKGRTVLLEVDPPPPNLILAPDTQDPTQHGVSVSSRTICPTNNEPHLSGWTRDYSHSNTAVPPTTGRT
jgi:hypothetical protein